MPAAMEELLCTAGRTEGCVSITQVIGVLITALLTILFLQSGLDKVTDRKGNIEWLTGHFANSPFKNIVPLLVTQITLLELATGAVCAAGCVILLLGGSTFVALLGTALASVSLIALFLGQRLAKDYEGAAVLVNYFVLTIVGLYILGG